MEKGEIEVKPRYKLCLILTVCLIRGFSLISANTFEQENQAEAPSKMLSGKSLVNYFARPLCLGIAFEKQAGLSSKLLEELRESYIRRFQGPTRFSRDFVRDKQEEGPQGKLQYRCDLIFLGKWGDAAIKKADAEEIELIMVFRDLKAKKTKPTRGRYTDGKDKKSVKWYGAEASAQVRLYDRTNGEDPIAEWKALSNSKGSPPILLKKKGKIPKKTGIKKEEALVSLLLKTCIETSCQMICSRLWENRHTIGQFSPDVDGSVFITLWDVIGSFQKLGIMSNFLISPKYSIRKLMLKRWKTLGNSDEKDTALIQKELSAMKSAAFAIGAFGFGETRLLPAKTENLDNIASLEFQVKAKQEEKVDLLKERLKSEKKGKGFQEYHVVFISDGKSVLSIKKELDLLDWIDSMVTTLHFDNPESKRYKVKGKEPVLLLVEKPLNRAKTKGRKRKTQKVNVIKKATGDQITSGLLEEYLLEGLELARIKMIK